MIEKVR